MQVDPRERLLVLDRSNKRVQVFDKTGELLDIWTDVLSGKGAGRRGQELRAESGVDGAYRDRRKMTTETTWSPVEGDLQTILASHPRPLEELLSGEVPAFIMRGAYDSDHAAALVRRFYDRGLLFDPRTRDEKIGRVDIGTSMGGRGSDQEAFFAHAEQTHELFETFFDGYDDPVELIYDTLTALAVDKRAVVGHEPDGRRYGPAIFRTYYEGRGHGPHLDVLARDRLVGGSRAGYDIIRFERQLSAVLCFQPAEFDEERGQTFVYRKRWDPSLPKGWNKTWVGDADSAGIDRVRIQLEAGDLYVFCSEFVHEVPLVRGDTPRIVLAAFCGWSQDEDEMFVWS